MRSARQTRILQVKNEQIICIYKDDYSYLFYFFTVEAFYSLLVISFFGMACAKQLNGIRYDN